jgi:hypothetical protein
VRGSYSSVLAGRPSTSRTSSSMCWRWRSPASIIKSRLGIRLIRTFFLRKLRRLVPFRFKNTSASASRSLGIVVTKIIAFFRSGERSTLVTVIIGSVLASCWMNVATCSAISVATFCFLSVFINE